MISLFQMVSSSLVRLDHAPPKPGTKIFLESEHHFQAIIHIYSHVFLTYSLPPATSSDI